MYCAKTAEPIEIGADSPRNHVLDGVQNPREDAILGVVRPTDKHLEYLKLCTQQKGSFSPHYGHDMRCGLLFDYLLTFVFPLFSVIGYVR